MRILHTIFSIFLCIVTILFLSGYLWIPEDWHISRSIMIHASTDAIYPWISDLKKWKYWSPWSKDEYNHKIPYVYSGINEGIGADVSWSSDSLGKGLMELTAANLSEGVSYVLLNNAHESKTRIHGSIKLTQYDGKTKVTWTNHVFSEHRFFQRWIIKKKLDQEMQSGLKNLKKSLYHS